MINISKALFPVHFPFKLEETVVRDFKLLSSAFVGDLLDTFLKSSNAKQNFQHGPIKIAELGVEVSHLGSLAMIRGFKFEGFLLETKLTNKALAEKIRDNLLQSKFHFFFFFNMSCQQSDLFFYFPLLVWHFLVYVVCILRIGHSTPCKKAPPSESKPAVNPYNCTKEGESLYTCTTNIEE